MSQYDPVFLLPQLHEHLFYSDTSICTSTRTNCPDTRYKEEEPPCSKEKKRLDNPDGALVLSIDKNPNLSTSTQLRN